MIETLELFKNFVNEYKMQNDKEYIDMLVNKPMERVIFNINDMRIYNSLLATNLINDSANIIPHIESIIRDITRIDTKFGITGSFGEYKLSPRDLGSLFIGKLICIEGIVTSCSVCRPKVVKSVHYNNYKNAFVQKEYRDSTMITKLPVTNTVYPIRDTDGALLITEYGYSEYIDYQTINIQEMPEHAPCGQLPRNLECILSHDLVDSVKPGDRVRVYGIYKSLCTQSNEFPTQFRNILIGNNVEHLKRKEFVMSYLNIFNVDNFVQYVAPSIWGHNTIKKALGLMLVGGNEITMINGSKIRGDINILLIGDPSTAKSQLLRFVYNFCDISVATTGKGSSGVGLTAAVVMDKDTGDKKLEAGAMVLADRGVICIDEFDKMNDSDRVAIHEVMEQQTVTISKAGIHTTLNARCSVLAAANPIYGMYKGTKKPSENIRLPESILTRFDLMFIVLDKYDLATDQFISDHIVKMHSNRSNIVDNEKLGGFKEYINRCKLLKPVLTKEASRLIITEYGMLRQNKNKKERVVSVTPRMLETMIRLSTAHAKLRCSDIVEIEDVEVILEMLNGTLYHQIVKDTKKRKVIDCPSTIDLDRDLKMMENENAKKDYVINFLYDFRLKNEAISFVSLDDIYEKMDASLNILKHEIQNILEELSSQNIIYFSDGQVNFIN